MVFLNLKLSVVLLLHAFHVFFSLRIVLSSLSCYSYHLFIGSMLKSSAIYHFAYWDTYVFFLFVETHSSILLDAFRDIKGPSLWFGGLEFINSTVCLHLKNH